MSLNYLHEHRAEFQAVIDRAVKAFEQDAEMTIEILSAASKINQRKIEREALSADLSA
ncbi:hypothetical protein [Herbiconiux sp. VKM Ac-2851]|uniref:hypothetical protein n=1 Tax=Herbiconiux sp. VKM Ac-2851 TaxID=2739025 RepID=UPI0015642BDC|nr:hypothetical protein [Herbiconiux sp. VKM Ac-2851]NQX33593.1 hypothetical protein [Herbiconiux sp. VKM Ac-2851]